MFKNNLKIAWRSLKKQPFFTFLNIFGLAIGMAGGLLLSLYIYDELSYDKMFADAERIYRVNADVKFGGKEEQMAEVSAPMGETMLRDFPEVELATRFRGIGSVFIKEEGVRSNVREPGVTYADSTFFKMLGVELLYGDEFTALKEPNTVVMSKTAAEKHFPIDQAVGKTVVLNDQDVYTVSGVIEDMPHNSFLQDRGLFLSMAGYEDSRAGDWGSHNFYTLVKLIPGAKPQDIQDKLQGMVGKYLIPYVQRYFPGITEEQFIASGNYMKYSTIALTDIHLHSGRSPEFSPVSDIKNVYILSAIAIILLVLASVNFMNLTTAHSLKRSKEVGIRKTLGSQRSSLIGQFLTESGLITFGALLFAVLIAVIAMPFYNEISGKELSIPFGNPLFWIILLVASLALGVLSGSYPAFFMSKFVAAKVLKGQGDNSIGGGRVRNILVILQFSISVILIMGTLVVSQQLRYIQGKDLGYAKDQVLVIRGVNGLEGNRTAFKNEVEQLSQTSTATLSSYLPTPSSRSDSSFMRKEDRSQEKAINMQQWRVDEDYISTMGLTLISGRNFDTARYASDSTGIILNEKAVSILGKTPETVLGQQFVNDFDDESLITVIGVIKDFHFESLRTQVESLALFYGGEFASNLSVKLNEGDVTRTIADIENIWMDIAPTQPFEYYFMDDSFNTSYEAEQRLGQIFMIFTILSILIACLGLFGLAAFNAQKRVKEIGVRKVLGAGVGQIVYRLSMDFLKLVGLSVIIALPLGWYAMDRWLEDFSYRIDIPWWIFALSALLAVGVALLTVSYQSIKAAIVNPVKSLRTE
ncbi:ABC transporter permease [Flagellimonas zhangzhouensis]|uniref:Putative ABC transport system permease protein n=1 Tax=Flagellimonas zhangzhouensis TaxID=1073328 RepID=A0A1H2UX03_9FLAO|nr:ABC transporter permease [Allomuricauda zhangzhouensis]SDQ12854.1 putative ABC transport system permease protein [Allomuricauda zhangzhouensis]SDW60617.1 putative ABC transport system permease protein [Allomuricauda zhangzhouensis]